VLTDAGAGWSDVACPRGFYAAVYRRNLRRVMHSPGSSCHTPATRNSSTESRAPVLLRATSRQCRQRMPGPGRASNSWPVSSTKGASNVIVISIMGSVGRDLPRRSFDHHTGGARRNSPGPGRPSPRCRPRRRCGCRRACAALFTERDVASRRTCVGYSLRHRRIAPTLPLPNGHPSPLFGAGDEMMETVAFQ
jgi:hypothetical protein